MKQLLLSFFLVSLTVSGFTQVTVTAVPGSCNGSNNLYNLTGNIRGTMPTDGQIVVSVAGEGIKIYELPFSDPLSYSVTGLNADGAPKTVVVTFTNGLSGTPATYTAAYTAPVACITSTCTGGISGEETNTFNLPLQTTDFFDVPITLPKFNTVGDTRILQKVLISVKSTMLSNALAENKSGAASNLALFSINNTSEITQGGSTFISLPDLKYSYKNTLLAPAVIIGASGGYPGDISLSTLSGMAALTPSPILDLTTFTNPKLNPNWVTTLTGNATDDDDIVYFPKNSAYSTNNSVYTGTLDDFIGAGDLGYAFTTISGYSFSGGGGNTDFLLSTKAALTFTITYYYCTASTLPIKLLSLNATNADNNSVKVNWTLEEQSNVSHYEVEQSNDAVNFKSVGTVAAATDLNYSFNYANASEGVNYFRLLTVDKDGKKTYSYTVKVTVPGLGNKISIYPNPTASYVKISLGSSMLNKAAKVKILSLDGRILIEQQVNAFTSTAVVNVNNLPNGKYIISLETGAEVINKPFQVLR